MTGAIYTARKPAGQKRKEKKKKKKKRNEKEENKNSRHYKLKLNLPIVQFYELLGFLRFSISLQSKRLWIQFEYVFELTRRTLSKESCRVFHGSHCDNYNL